MSASTQFFDTNIVLYLLSADADKADRAEALLAGGGVISVQVLNEFASVASRKLNMPWADIREALNQVRAVCRVEMITVAIHERGIALAERQGFSLYDAMIAASALTAGCATLFTEDFHHGLVIEEQLTIANPFKN